MPKTSSLDVIMQQLDALTHAELLKVRAKVDALIEGKSLPLPNIFSAGSYQRMTSVSSDKRDIDIAIPLPALIPGSTIKGHINKVVQFSQLETKTDDSLKKVIELVDEWMDDAEGYDEETYTQIETALNQNRPSL
nr:hypothetical protein [Nostoc sp. ChiQUE02]MDZ8231808.1 hypothetical protein [Nostoc sp. ChiQUE02]